MATIFCPYPKMHYVINPEGVIRPCCISNSSDDPSFNVTIDDGDPLNHPSFQKIRQELSKGQWPKICNQCKIKEDIGIKSHRQNIEDKFLPVDVHLKYLDVKFSNVCNLACIMCSPINSSLLEEDYSKNPELAPNFISNPLLKIKKNNNVVDYVKKSIEQGLEILKVTGGEPFASIEFFEVIDFCIVNNYAKNIELKFTTNAVKINRYILDKILKFKNIDITVSVDGCNKIYDYIRYGANWKRTIENINTLKTITQLKFNTILTSYNVLNLNELEDTFIENLYIDIGLKPFSSELNSGFLPYELKQIAIGRVQNSHVKQYLEKSIYVESKCLEFKNTTLKYDKLRSRNYRDFLDPILINYLEKL